MSKQNSLTRLRPNAKANRRSPRHTSENSRQLCMAHLALGLGHRVGILSPGFRQAKETRALIRLRATAFACSHSSELEAVSSDQ